MMLNKKSGFFYKSFSFVVIALIIFGCASVQKPQGGPRDLTPPKLLKATPANMTRNFTGKQIQLDFDEYFNLTNQYQEISISPAMEKAPEYKIKKKSLVVNFKDSLQKNTTYVINFGKAIADVNEANVLKNFTYVFSTGNHIDSLSISGSVSNTLTQEKEKEATVMLFPLKQDSLLFGKKKPTIYASTDSSGNFSLNNLHDGDYRIYALKETSPNKIYDNDNELIAFLSKPIHLKKDTSNIELKLFKQVPEKFRLVDRRFDADGKMFFTFNKSLTNPSAKILYPPALDQQKIVDFNKTKDTAFIYMRNMDFDSIRVSFLDNNKPLDTVALRKGRKEIFQRAITLQYNINSNNKLKPNTDLTITANTPIDRFDQTLITLNEDSTNVSNYTLTRDTSNLRRLLVKYRWKQNSRYEIIFNEDALTNIYGDKNKKTLKRFQIDKPENYGTLTLKVNVPDSARSYIVELLNDQMNVLHTDVITQSTSLVYKNYLTGKYRVRVIYDTNKNGKWDSGNVKRKTQSENIWLDNKDITLRPNWEAEEVISIPKEPATP